MVRAAIIAKGFCAMKKILFALAFVFAFVFAACADQPALPTMGQPVLLTPFGQSQDANAVKLMTKKFAVDYEMACFADTVDWSKYKTMIVVLGGSGKGLGAAGLDIPSETARCTALVAAAKEHGVAILAMHIGGTDRRGPNSEPFLGFMGDADFAIVRSDGNADGFFTSLCAEKNVPMYTIEKVGDLRKVMPEILK